MKPKLLILAVVVGASVGLWQAVQEWQAKRHPNLATTEQFISFACDRALEDAQIHDHIALDYGVASLKQVDEILGRVHAEYVQNPGSVSVPGMSAEYGAYVGEVIRRSEPNAYWTRDSQVAGEKHIRSTGKQVSLIPWVGVRSASSMATKTAFGSSTRS